MGLLLQPFPIFQQGERVLAVRSPVRWVSGRSFPNYRVAFPLPPLIGIGLYITDRRVLYAYHALGLFNFQFCQWYPGQENAPEIITSVRLGRHPILGSYIEIASESQTRHFYRSRKAAIRCYTKSPEELRQFMPV